MIGRLIFAFLLNTVQIEHHIMLHHEVIIFTQLRKYSNTCGEGADARESLTPWVLLAFWNNILLANTIKCLFVKPIRICLWQFCITNLHTREFFLTLFLIASINARIFYLTNQQVVLIELRFKTHIKGANQNFQIVLEFISQFIH